MVDNNLSCVKYLTIPPTIVGLGYYVMYNDLITNFYIITPVSFIIGLLLINLFPPIAIYLFKRPVYYEDLVERIDGHKIQVYQNFFIYLIVFVHHTISIFTDYIFLIHNTTLNYFELVGVLGGIFGLFKKWQLICGTVLMRCVVLCKKNKLLENNTCSLTPLEIV